MKNANTVSYSKVSAPKYVPGKAKSGVDPQFSQYSTGITRARGGKRPTVKAVGYSQAD